MSQQSLGDHLRYYRLRSALTQEELSERTGVSVRTIRDLERGRGRSSQQRSLELIAGGLVLHGDEAGQFLALASKPGTDAGVTPVPKVPVTRNLPFVPHDLLGRDAELDWVREQADLAHGADSVRVIVLHGAPGIGKTSLAVRAGHRLQDGFPDGCLFLDMNGMDAAPMSSEGAARRLLLDLGTPEPAIPEDSGQRLGLYRWLLRERSLLLLLDNVADEAQIRPLLAVSPGSLVVVTSRSVLAGLDAVQRLEVDLLDHGSAAGVLDAIAGADRTAAEPGATERVVQLCGGIPLALRIAGNRLASRPRWSIAAFADQLELDARRLSALSVGDVHVRAAFELSHRQLSPAAAMMFRRLSAVPGKEFGLGLAVVVADQDAAAADSALTELADASMLRPGDEPDRYSFHDLLLLYAREVQAEAVDDTDAVNLRMSRWLLTTAITATRHFHPDRVPTAADLRVFADLDHADRWLAREVDHWLGALRIAVGQRRHSEVLDLAHAMHWYSDHRGGADLWFEVYGAGVTAAGAVGTARDLAVQLNFLTWVLAFRLWRWEDAVETADRALDAATTAGDLVEQGWACYYRGGVELRRGHAADAVRWGQRAIALFAEAGYETGETLALSYVGDALRETGRAEEAIELQQQAVRRHLAAGAGTGGSGDDNLSSTYLNLAESLSAVGRGAEALVAVDEAERHLGAGAVFGHAHLRFVRANAVVGLGDAERARVLLEAALELAPSPEHELRLLVLLVAVCDELGRPDEAHRHRVRGAATMSRHDVALGRERVAAYAEGLRFSAEIFAI